ncbi:MAG: SUMF1/EgtB/PvdO family nonheme iron enzyme [Chitinivibrionia bacterium]|nr:SUMF1/EgtB/PvdO family nonheme iron enzyme [Chitinivibrionia bacterium]
MKNSVKFFAAILVIVAGVSAQNVSISNAQELRDFAAQVNSGNNFIGRTITLTADIDLNGTPEWVPIANTEARAFMGTFNGNGRTVSGVKINNLSTDGNLGFFGVIGNSGVVRNLSVDVNIVGGNLAGAIAAVNRGTIEEVRVSGLVAAPTVGGLVAENRGTIRNFHSSVQTVVAVGTAGFPLSTTLPLNPGEGQGVRLMVRGIYIDLIYVAPGTFRFGACASRTPATVGTNHTISRGFWIGRFPITQAQYQAVMTGHPTLSAVPSHFRGGAAAGSTNLPNNPVEMVSFNDITSADGFLARIGARLPTEFEWEFAARGGNRRQGNNGGVDFIWAGSNTVTEVAWHNANSGSQTRPVGGLAPNELGIHDMSGNVWEWTSTVSGSHRVFRGGCWNYVAEGTRVALRNFNRPDIRWLLSGFRVALSPNSNISTTIEQTTPANAATGGGAVGVNFGTIENGYSTGSVFGSTTNIGGLIGVNQGGTITNSFFDSQTSGRNDDGRGIPRTTFQMRQQSTFIGWDFNNIWDINPDTNNGMPFLRMNTGDNGTFIRPRPDAQPREHGIIIENAIVSEVAKISVITSEPATINLRILDNLGNVVFTETAAYGRVSNPPVQNAADNAIIWDLTNQSGRFVANGTYLIIAEATGISGRRFTYSARIGVNR